MFGLGKTSYEWPVKVLFLNFLAYKKKYRYIIYT